MTVTTAGAIDAGQASIGFSRLPSEPSSEHDFVLPGFPDNRIAALSCRIGNARQLADCSLDRQGFALVRHKSAYAHSRDRAAYRDYPGEVAEFLKDCLGASLVVPSQRGLCLRSAARTLTPVAPGEEDGLVDDQAPANFAHIDYLMPDMVRLDADLDAQNQGHDVSGYSRMMLLQTWRSLSPPPQDLPLALCDRRTMESADIVTIKGVLPRQNNHDVAEQVYHVGGIHFTPDQEWYFFPSMDAEDLLLFVGMDTAQESGGQVAHGAFDNSANEPAANPRESIEARFYAYFD